MNDPVTPDGRYFVVRGPVWWHDGAPDDNRRMARHTPYADWYAARERGAATSPPIVEPDEI